MKKIDYYTLFARIALSFAFLSAVADRFGLWNSIIGPQNVTWGNMERFTAYTATLIPYIPLKLVPLFAWGATVAETVIGISLLVGTFKRLTYLSSGILLLIFGLSMLFFLNVKAPLDYSVFTAAACSFLLYKQQTARKS